MILRRNLRVAWLLCAMSLVVLGVSSDPVRPTTVTPPSTATSTVASTTPTTRTPPPPSAVKPGSDGEDCYLGKASKREEQLIEIVKLLKNESYTWQDDEHEYRLGVCKTALNAVDKSAGFVQKNRQTNNTFVLGRLNDVDVESVENVIRVSYNDGDNYQRACNRTQRNAVIYFVCDPNQAKDSFNMIEENNEREKGCAYIFELKTAKICQNLTNMTTTTTTTTPTTPMTTTPATTTTSLPTSSTTTSRNANTTTPKADPHKGTSAVGIVSILLICVGVIATIYMLIGTLYLRIVNQARGWEQIPHIEMWRSIGGGFADCCNYMCRCGQRRTEVHTYENINDRISDDENLLNM